ncbi:hypothetical protein OKT22_17745 [Providencia rettgeri]|uniref:hypothetical protein n=1 Tax=Providencia rettgeri TaxID=587 RepID=UPI0022720437|nr:hypothetical protein [Providencia rettgeri]MCX9110859.1 hypothetical protein [Providencia rettgeri]
MPIFGKQKFDERKYSSMSLNDMVNKIKEKPDAFEGNSCVVVNKIKEIKNKGDSGWSEIKDVWSVEPKGEAKKKLKKYFKKGLKESYVVLKNEIANKKVVANIKDEKFSNQPANIETKERIVDSTGCNRSGLSKEVKKEVKDAIIKFEGDIKNELGFKLKKENKCDEIKTEIKKVKYDSIEDLVKELKSGADLSENGVSYIKFLMSYIRTREMLGGDDNIRKEIDNLFIKIYNSLSNIEDQKKVLGIYQDTRFLSIYDAYFRTAASLIVNKLENSNFSRDIIEVIKNKMAKYANEHIDVLKSNQSEYMSKIKDIKNIKDNESRNAMNNIESIKRIKLINKLLSNGELTGEKSKYLPELANDEKVRNIMGFFDEKIKMNIELLKSECDDKVKEDVYKRDTYISTQKQYIDGTILNIKDLLTKKSVSSKTITLIEQMLDDKKSKENIDTFPSKLDLILNLLQRKKITSRKIHDDIKKYLDLSPDQLVKKIDEIMDSNVSPRGRFFFRFNHFKERLVSFIFNTMGLFK